MKDTSSYEFIPIGKFQIIMLNFPNSELQETHFHAFYHMRRYYYNKLF